MVESNGPPAFNYQLVTFNRPRGAAYTFRVITFEFRPLSS